MRTEAEGQVLVGILPGDVQAVRIGEHRRVAVGGPVVHGDLLPLGDQLPADLHVLRRRAAHVDHRADHADELVHGIGQQRAVRRQSGLLVRELRHQLHRAGDGVAGGVIAREHDQQPRAVQILVGQEFPVQLGPGDGGQQVRLRVLSALVQNVAAIFEHGLDVLVELLDEHHQLGRQRQLALAAVRRQVSGQLQIMHPFQELGPIFYGHAEDLAQGEQRQAGGDLLHQIASPHGGHGIDQGSDLMADTLLQPVHIGGREEGHVLPPQVQVPGLVHVDHGVQRGAEQQRVTGLRRAGGQQDAPPLGGEGLRVCIDPRDIVEPGQGPEAGIVRRGVQPRHRGALPQPGKGTVGRPVLEGEGILEGDVRGHGIDRRMARGRRPAGDRGLADELHGVLGLKWDRRGRRSRMRRRRYSSPSWREGPVRSGSPASSPRSGPRTARGGAG